MENNAPKMKNEKQSLDRAAYLFDNVVTNAYLKELQKCEIIPWQKPKQLTEVRWYQITKIVMEKGVFFADKLSMLYNSLHKNAKDVILALKKNNGFIDLYLGARDFVGDGFVSGEVLEAGLRGFLPGVGVGHNPNISVVAEIDEKKNCVSCVSVLASLRDDKKENFVQGIEKLINSSSSIPSYSAFFIAENVSDETAKTMIQGFNAIQTWLSPIAENQVTFSESHTDGVSESLTKSFSETIGKNISKTVTHNNGWSISSSESGGHSLGTNENCSVVIFSEGFNENWQEGWSDQVGLNGSFAKAIQQGISKSEQKGSQETNGVSSSDTEGTSFQITHKNSQIKEYTEIIDKQVERLRNGISFGLWSVATYFVAPKETTALKLANIYKGCVTGEKSNLSVGAINCWEENEAKEILKYLKDLTHPHFKYKGVVDVSPGTIVTSEELAIHLSLPQSSVPGILVREEQSFGRNVTTEEQQTDENSICLGNIMYLGNEEEQKVRISIESLKKHAFVTGTTGSGKSNSMYLMLDSLMKKGKKILVIEPAKGEYKNVFGNRENVNVYGCDPRVTNLLKINPFEFPQSIDVYEHIDSLVEVFNACWPMYAAMPQVLNHSIIEAYKACGWNMERSLNPNGIFPTIEDVLDCLKEYINSSEYSSDTKGNYKGSLETRLQSLCDGMVGRMLTGTAIQDKELFNHNVIVDLSDIGSSETKSLIMGLLILKLNEFRRSENAEMNRDLHHITILEEAHNLLKRVSTNQIAESSNVAGMAVEKIANSMAEMRTYGEGFIIVDQSPSMLDLSTIRNTNTKIVMALPEKDDREIAGKSIGLDDKHIEEISRLKTGEAVVYQSGWEEAVKTKVMLFKHDQLCRKCGTIIPTDKTKKCPKCGAKVTGKSNWKYNPENDMVEESSQTILNEIYNTLYLCYTSIDADINRQELLDKLKKAKVSGGRYCTIKTKMDSLSKSKATPEDIAFIFASIVGTEVFESSKRFPDMANLNAYIARELSHKTGIPNDNRINGFVNMYMKGCSAKALVPFYEGWLQSTLKNV